MGKRLKTVLVFVSSTCPHCPSSKKLVQKVVPSYAEYGVFWKKIRVKTSEGKKLSKEYGVRGIPAIILLDEDRCELERFVGTPSEEKLKSAIETHLGIRKPFFSRLFGR